MEGFFFKWGHCASNRRSTSAPLGKADEIYCIKLLDVGVLTRDFGLVFNLILVHDVIFV
jgi:hypothetical protein